MINSVLLVHYFIGIWG